MVLAGVAIYQPGWTWKLIVLIYFVILSNPATSHALARAAHKRSIFKTSATVVDELESYERDRGEEEIEEALEQSEC
jgi:multicomponent Na+:H+ antiporter subunit G